MSDAYRSRRTSYASHYSKLYRAGHRLTVPALGASRRVQALRRIGYSTADIAEGTGLSESLLGCLANGRRMKRIGLHAHRQIVEFYDTYSALPKVNTRVIQWAKKLDYAPPMAWDDIDDPNDYPKGVLQ